MQGTFMNFHHKKLPQKIDRFLSLTKKVRCRYSLCTLTTHKMRIWPLRCHYVMVVFSCYAKNNVKPYLPTLFPPRFGLLSLFDMSKAAKQNGSFKMISGPMLSTKYMSTCRTIRNQRKIPTWRLRLGVMAADADVDEGRTIREFVFLLFLF